MTHVNPPHFGLSHLGGYKKVSAGVSYISLEPLLRVHSAYHEEYFLPSRAPRWIEREHRLHRQINIWNKIKKDGQRCFT